MVLLREKDELIKKIKENEWEKEKKKGSESLITNKLAMRVGAFHAWHASSL